MGTQSSFQALPALIIPNGDTLSNALPAPSFVSCVALMLYGPSAVDGGVTYKIQVHPNRNAAAADAGWRTLIDDAAADLEAPGALKARVYTDLVLAGALRIKASGAVGAEREWKVTGVMTL